MFRSITRQFEEDVRMFCESTLYLMDVHGKSQSPFKIGYTDLSDEFCRERLSAMRKIARRYEKVYRRRKVIGFIKQLWRGKNPLRK